MSPGSYECESSIHSTNQSFESWLWIGYSASASVTVLHLILTRTLQAQYCFLYCTIDKTGLYAVRDMLKVTQLVTDTAGTWTQVQCTFYDAVEEERNLVSCGRTLTWVGNMADNWWLQHSMAGSNLEVSRSRVLFCLQGSAEGGWQRVKGKNQGRSS